MSLTGLSPVQGVRALAARSPAEYRREFQRMIVSAFLYNEAA
jgi:hypothetical protein